MKRRPFLAFALGAILVIFVSVNAIAGVVLKGVRLDLTADRLYSLSPGSRDVVDSLTEPVDLTLYFSRGLAQDYPALRAYGARVRETLQAFADRSRGKLRLTIVDPEPFSEQEDAAFAAGLEPVPLGDGASIYFGLVARNALDETGIVPLFSPDREPYLEYELTRTIADLREGRETKVAIITSLPMEQPAPGVLGGPAAPRPIHFYEQLLQSFEVVLLDQDFTAVPDDADVLVIAHPWELDEDQLWAVDQYVLKHGRALVMVDPYSRYSRSPGPTGFPDLDQPATSNLAPLLQAWGVAYDPRRVVLDRENALVAGVQEEGRRVERAYPLWFDAPPEQLSQRDLATVGLTRGVVLVSAGALDPLDAPGITFEPLVRTSSDARVIDVDDTIDAEPRKLVEGYEPEGSFVVAARVSGEMKTAFPDGAPDGVRDPQGALDRGQADIVVVADSDLLDDTFYVVRDPGYGDAAQADNAAFLINAIDLLAGSDALVSLRSRARANRPLTVLDRMRETAEAALLSEQIELETELQAAEERMAELQAAVPEEAAGTELGLQAAREANAEYLRMRDIVLDTRARLRVIERSHRAAIDRLEAVVITANVWALPLLVALFGVGVFVLRRRSHGATP
jgi:ABC-type uncharacterized transport system involved in gliding motility auxiliary subunit